MVVRYIQECKISNLIRWVFLPVFFVLYKGWTVWIVSGFWAWHETILLSFSCQIFIKVNTRNLCAVQPFNKFIIMYQIAFIRLTKVWFENSRYFVLSSLKTKLFRKTQYDTVCRFILTFQYNFVGFLTCNVGTTWHHRRIVKNYRWCCLLCLQSIS